MRCSTKLVLVWTVPLSEYALRICLKLFYSWNGCESFCNRHSEHLPLVVLTWWWRLSGLRKTVKKYASWFNNDRISMVLNGLTPREYRQQFKLSKSV
ncbi:IS3 family transposase [Lacticaseibacillus pantheris]|uniref:IS3 family transposase n=1 Tax=Lacticaseibacillus pantheris TaxID=171523 RepID=UPI003455A00B